MSKLTDTLDAVKTELTAAGVTSIFKHHAPPNKDHVLLTSSDQYPTTGDGLQNYFADLVQITVLKIGTIEDILSLIDDILSIVGLNSFTGGSPLVKITLNRQSSPIRRTSNQWEWVGLFEVVGCF